MTVIPKPLKWCMEVHSYGHLHLQVLFGARNAPRCALWLYTLWDFIKSHLDIPWPTSSFKRKGQHLLKLTIKQAENIYLTPIANFNWLKKIWQRPFWLLSLSIVPALVFASFPIFPMWQILVASSVVCKTQSRFFVRRIICHDRAVLNRSLEHEIRPSLGFVVASSEMWSNQFIQHERRIHWRICETTRATHSKTYLWKLFYENWSAFRNQEKIKQEINSKFIKKIDKTCKLCDQNMNKNQVKQFWQTECQLLVQVHWATPVNSLFETDSLPKVSRCFVQLRLVFHLIIVFTGDRMSFWIVVT